MTAMFGQRAALLRPTDLKAIENDLARLSETIRSLTGPSEILVDAGGQETPSSMGDVAEKRLGSLARRLLRESDARQAVLPFGITVDPAWHMLLDLFAAETEGKAISVSSACIASGAPHTTALRYLNQLCEKGAVIRAPDTVDGRRMHIHLAEEFRSRIRDYLVLVAEGREEHQTP
ncbi:helix-turn-helix domain-containing protein [Sphingobium fuliginis]|nr:hypothetical protein [Sphingobium fuliginis]RYM01066.1 hypothetical protein EWH10_03195 [Sphingobium fuliginis]